MAMSSEWILFKYGLLYLQSRDQEFPREIFRIGKLSITVGGYTNIESIVSS